MPPSDNGFYTDPKTGILTPKNANGRMNGLAPPSDEIADGSGNPDPTLV